MAIEKLLKTRAAVKKRKPTYKRVQSHQFAKLSEVKWRKPKGMGNKVRRNRRGKPSMPQVGFGSPKAIKGYNKEGFKEVIVNNVSELKNVNTKTEVAMVGGNVGAKKKLEILAEAKKANIKVSNVKNVEEKIKSLTKTSKKVEPKKEEKKVEAKADTKKSDSTKEVKKE